MSMGIDVLQKIKLKITVIISLQLYGTNSNLVIFKLDR